ncbi:hypothetical protein LXL04_027666 [Taraxacum kok-saghyz]
MSLLIQGPKQPGNDIDVYLAPLIEDMKKLWIFGVEVYDAYKKEHFQLRAMIYCTISDFPAYANLSGYSTKGKKACPVCEEDTRSMRLKNCNKFVYMGHQRSLPKTHLYRTRGNLFDGKDESEYMTPPMDGNMTFDRVRNLEDVWNKTWYPKAEDHVNTEKTWYVVDASDKILGRLASAIAVHIRGKNLATYTPSVDMGAFVIVV